MKKYLSLFLILTLLLILSACGKSEENSSSNTVDDKKIIKIGYLPITHAAPLYMQTDKEYEGYAIELVKFGSWPELMDALNTGKIDGASVLIQLAMKAKEQGIDLKAVALGHRDGNVVVVAPNVQKVEDLKGKSFAIPNKYSTHNILLYRMLQDAGINYQDVDVVELPPAEMPAALAEGRIAGYVVAEPFGAISVSLEKGKVLFQSEDIWPNSIDCGLVLRNAFIEKHKDIANQFVKDYAAAGELMNANDDHAHEVVAKYIKVDKEVLDLSLNWISYNNLKIEKDAYKILRDSLIEMGLSENPPTYDEFVDSSLIEEK
ncbi:MULTISPECIES: ABC transporter substrate-binding protein [Lysinibacillus]|uniref:ABC transporter substrate-binding protein n=1 Tax=Lysinibacillus TaxID=400634 RepID=UPI00257CC65E|nr:MULTISPECIES: ABC transporter substrate-binding protein [Lysinibacillus]